MQPMKLLLFIITLSMFAQEVNITYAVAPLSPVDQTALAAAEAKVVQAQADLETLKKNIKARIAPGVSDTPPTPITNRMRLAATPGSCVVKHSEASFTGTNLLITTTTHNLCAK